MQGVKNKFFYYLSLFKVWLWKKEVKRSIFSSHLISFYIFPWSYFNAAMIVLFKCSHYCCKKILYENFLISLSYTFFRESLIFRGKVGKVGKFLSHIVFKQIKNRKISPIFPPRWEFFPPFLFFIPEKGEKGENGGKI